MEKKKDYLNGDHSARNWFRIMWENFYIQLVLLAIGFIALLFIYGQDLTIWQFAGLLSIPVLAIAAIVFFGFIQFWNDLKNGRSR